ncbi:glycosyl hydrolase family 8 [Rhodospirillum sp. A1_3_36]|uniref:glycosyl hydrolase family 8 n=1 Tax=Rhodospirillum sp. A1_3_36 TaxID=3391666 RepID=UPI0039A4FDF7
MHPRPILPGLSPGLFLNSLLLLAFLTLPARAEEVTQAGHPYALGVILPDSPEADRDKALTDFYTQWKSLYLTEGCGKDRAYVNVGADGKAMQGGAAEDTITVSEAHGYGMLITVLMADKDPKAHALFDDMVRFFRDHPAASGPGLMAWNQVLGCDDASGRVNGATTASDGDLDIAMALLLADKTWGSKGAISYKTEAKTVLAAILAREVAAEDRYMLLGDWAKAPDPENPDRAITTRTSDFMPGHFTAFARTTGETRWYDLRDQSYALLEQLRHRWARDTGLVPDFIIARLEGPEPAARNVLEGEGDGAFSWNAARVPWRIAMDAVLYGNQRARAALLPMIAWIRKDTGDDPSQINAGYWLSGAPMADQGEDQMAFLAPMAVAAMVDPDHQKWLDALWKDITKRSLADEDYYGNTLKLLCMIVLTGHWPPL